MSRKPSGRRRRARSGKAVPARRPGATAGGERPKRRSTAAGQARPGAKARKTGSGKKAPSKAVPTWQQARPREPFPLGPGNRPTRVRPLQVAGPALRYEYGFPAREAADPWVDEGGEAGESSA